MSVSGSDPFRQRLHGFAVCVGNADALRVRGGQYVRDSVGHAVCVEVKFVARNPACV